jgi:CheY-like chemotaxis protein
MSRIGWCNAVTDQGISMLMLLPYVLAAAVGAGIALRGQRIIIVDDNMTNRKVLMGQLSPVTHRDLTDCLMMVLGTQAEDWRMATQPIVTRHALRSQRVRDSHHILLAEDNPVNQKVACRILEQLGYRVDVAADGQAAFSAWESSRYQLILMDCQMPVMDGYETTKKIRDNERPGERIPIIALTAHAMKGADNECLGAGMDDYLAKPIDKEQLQNTLMRWMEGSEPVVGQAVG